MMEVGAENHEIARTIVALAHSLNLQVVAEGVETVTQQHMLRALGCEYAQGFYYSRPVDEATVLAQGLVAKVWPVADPAADADADDADASHPHVVGER